MMIDVAASDSSDPQKSCSGWWNEPDPEWTAVAAAMAKLKELAGTISKTDGQYRNEKERAKLLHKFMLEDDYTTAMRDAVAILSSREQLSWNSASGAFAALSMLLFDMPKNRSYAYAYFLKLFKGFEVEFVEQKLKDHSFDYWARMPKSKRDAHRKRWLLERDRQAQHQATLSSR